jgi:hypothetical protein
MGTRRKATERRTSRRRTERRRSTQPSRTQHRQAKTATTLLTMAASTRLRLLLPFSLLPPSPRPLDHLPSSPPALPHPLPLLSSPSLPPPPQRLFPPCASPLSLAMPTAATQPLPVFHAPQSAHEDVARFLRLRRHLRVLRGVGCGGRRRRRYSDKSGRCRSGGSWSGSWRRGIAAEAQR